MAQPLPPIANTKRHISVVRDRYGEVVAAFDTQNVTVVHPGGSTSQYAVYDHIELMCGHVYSPAMSLGKDPVLLLGVCEACRRPRSAAEWPMHGLTSKAAGLQCQKCGVFLCPRHAQRDAEGHVFCPDHARSQVIDSFVAGTGHALKWGLTKLFFKEE